MADILIVDDTPANLQVLGGMLKQNGYKVRPVPNGRLALQAAQKETPDLVLLDIMMPEMDGYEVCAQFKKDSKLHDIPVIFISALSETLDKVKAFSVGGVDYISKPFQFDEVKARVNTHLDLRALQVALEVRNQHLSELVKEQVKEIADSQMATILALAKLAERRDDVTGRHLERVQLLSKLLAQRLFDTGRYTGIVNKGFIENIFHASPLHDIGKVGIPDNILLKPGGLTKEEFEVMKTHTDIGAQTLQAVRATYPKNSFINMGIEIAQSHHEKWDGAGYPQGLVAEAIPLGARIMAIVDVYDALRSVRPYKPAFSHMKSCEIIYRGRGTHFDPELSEVFIELQEQFAEIRNQYSD